MERVLAPHEAAIAAAGVRVVLSCDVEGDLDEAVLAQALTHLQEATPLLTGKITQAPGQLPRVRIADGGPAQILGHGTDFDEVINTPLDWEQGPLLRATVVCERERTRVVLSLPRAFVDGMSYLSLHYRLWDTYTSLATGRPVGTGSIEPVLGPALDDLLAPLFTPGPLQDFVAERARLDAERPPALVPALASDNGLPGADMRFRIIGIDLAEGRCQKLMELAREASLSVNSLVSGVLLTSLAPLLPAQDGPARLLCTTAVDMRRRLTPPLPAEVLQSAATTTTLRLEISEDTHPVTVGKDVAARLRADLDSGAAAMELAAFPYMLDQHPPSIVITNVGTLTEHPSPPGLRISNVRLAPLGHVPMIFAVVSRPPARLAIDLTYSRAWYTDTQIEKLRDHVAVALDQLVRPSVTNE